MLASRTIGLRVTHRARQLPDIEPASAVQHELGAYRGTMTYSAIDELGDRIAMISVAAEHFVGVNEVEHLLEDLLRLLESGRLGQAEATATLTELLKEWPWGAVEILEFTMRALRWDGVREALSEQLADDADFRLQNLARQALEVYEDEWPGGEIYRRYRD